MTNETKSETGAAYDGAAVAVFGGLAANALTAFAIQAWMTFGFADEVWKIPFALCIALIAALDLFAIMFMILTYLLRGTGWPRAVATTVFIFAIGAQVAAAEMFGAHRQWSTEVRIFSVLPAVFLAAAQEGVVLWRTHRNTAAERAQAKAGKAIEKAPKPGPERKPTPAPVKPAPRPAPEKPQVKAEVKPSAPVVRKPAPTAPARRGEDPAKAEAVRAVLASERKPAEVAEQFGVSKRAVEIWVQKARNAATPAETPVKSIPDQPERVTVLPAATTVNGHATPAATPEGGTTR